MSSTPRIGSHRIPHIILSTMLLAGTMATPAFGAADRLWVTGYNGPTSDEDRVRDVAVHDGAIYVTGWTLDGYWRAFATVKYDYCGDEEWSQVYNGFTGPNQPDEAEAIAIDADGYVYVTGWSTERFDMGASSVDIVTLKYDPDGNLLWERRYRTDGGNNQPSDLAIGPDGGVYIAGASWVGAGFDLLLLKYQPDGTLEWARTTGQPGDRWDAGYALAVDGDNSTIVVGYTEPLVSLDSGAYVVKYDAAGDLVWARVRDGFNTVEAAERVVFGEDGLIYVLGEVSPPAEPLHIWTAAYDASGIMHWEDLRAGTADLSNYAGGLASVPGGGVAVSGQRWDDTIAMTTLKYASDGALLWERIEQAGYAAASAADVAVGADGAVYTVGYGYNSNGAEDMLTVRYEPDGAHAWTQVYADPNGRSDRARHVTVDTAQNVFVVGEVWAGFANYYDFATIRYRQGGGDLNLDGQVDARDVVLLAECLNGPDTAVDGACTTGDAACDGDVDLRDLAVLQNAFGR